MPRRAGSVAGQFLRFGIVGGIGFVVDAGLLHLLMMLGLGPYSGRVVSFLAAATATWILNRTFTFRRENPTTAHPAPMHPTGEWLAYLGLMVIGGMANYGTYALAVAFTEPVRRHPELGVALGSVVGMGINFWTAKTMVFERKARS